MHSFVHRKFNSSQKVTNMDQSSKNRAEYRPEPVIKSINEKGADVEDEDPAVWLDRFLETNPDIDGEISPSPTETKDVDEGSSSSIDLKDVDPADWLDKFLETNPDLVDDQCESSDGQGNSRENNDFRESSGDEADHVLQGDVSSGESEDETSSVRQNRDGESDKEMLLRKDEEPHAPKTPHKNKTSGLGDSETSQDEDANDDISLVNPWKKGDYDKEKPDTATPVESDKDLKTSDKIERDYSGESPKESYSEEGTSVSSHDDKPLDILEEDCAQEGDDDKEETCSTTPVKPFADDTSGSDKEDTKELTLSSDPHSNRSLGIETTEEDDNGDAPDHIHQSEPRSGENEDEIPFGKEERDGERDEKELLEEDKDPSSSESSLDSKLSRLGESETNQDEDDGRKLVDPWKREGEEKNPDTMIPGQLDQDLTTSDNLAPDGNGEGAEECGKGTLVSYHEDKPSDSLKKDSGQEKQEDDEEVVNSITPKTPLVDDAEEEPFGGDNESEEGTPPSDPLNKRPSGSGRDDPMGEGGNGTAHLKEREEDDGEANDNTTTPMVPVAGDGLDPNQPPEEDGISPSDPHRTTDEDPPSPGIPTPPSPTDNDTEALIGSEANESSWTYASYLIQHFNILYGVRVSPKRGDGSNPCGILHLVLFFLVTFLSLLDGLSRIKNHLSFGDKELHIGLYYFTAGYYIIISLLQVCLAYLLVFRFQSILDIIEAVGCLGGRSSRKMVAMVVWVPSILTILVSVTIPFLFVIPFLDDEWEWKEFLLRRSFALSKTLFLWTDEDYENQTICLHETYGTNISVTTVSMAVTGYSIRIAGYLGHNVVIDTSLAFAFTFYVINGSLENDLKRAQANPNHENRKILWTNYQTYRSLSTMFNECCWLFFQLIHLGNLLYILYFFFDHLIFHQDPIIALPKLFVIAKMIPFYYFSFKSSMSSKFHKWVQTTFRGPDALFIEGPDPVTVANVLEELSTYPVGIGEGLFFIDRSFIYRFIGAIASYFCFLSQTAQDLLDDER